MSEQTVVEDSNASEKENPNAAASDAQDESLDDILASYDREAEQEATPKTEPKSSKDSGVDDQTAQLLKEWAASQHAEQFNKAMEKAVGTMRETAEAEGVNVDLSDRVWRGILYDAAESDPRVKTAFINRTKNPAGFTKMLKALAREEAGNLKVSKEDTKTRSEVTAAVRASKKQAPADPDQERSEFERKYLSASPADRAKMKQELIRRTQYGA